MSEETLQSDDDSEVLDDNANLIQEDSALATDSEEAHEAKPQENSIDQDAVNKVINKKHFEKMEAERNAAASDKLNKELQAKLDAMQPQANTIPDMPDPFDDDFIQKSRQRDEAIERAAQQRAQNDLIAQQQQAQQAEQQRVRQEEQTAAVTKYVDRAKAFGISQEELQTAGNDLAVYNLNEELQMRIIQDDDGPLISRYLQSNALEASNVAQMHPMDAYAYVLNTVKPKAAQLKPRTSNAPAPAQDLSGGNVDKDLGKYQHSKNATFE